MFWGYFLLHNDHVWHAESAYQQFWFNTQFRENCFNFQHNHTIIYLATVLVHHWVRFVVRLTWKMPFEIHFFSRYQPPPLHGFYFRPPSPTNISQLFFIMFKISPDPLPLGFLERKIHDTPSTLHGFRACFLPLAFNVYIYMYIYIYIYIYTIFWTFKYNCGAVSNFQSRILTFTWYSNLIFFPPIRLLKSFRNYQYFLKRIPVFIPILSIHLFCILLQTEEFIFHVASLKDPPALAYWP